MDTLSYNKLFIIKTLVYLPLHTTHTCTQIPLALIFARFMQPICSAKQFLAFKVKVTASFFMCFMHIYDNFTFSSQISHFLQKQSLLIRMPKLHEVARRPLLSTNISPFNHTTMQKSKE